MSTPTIVVTVDPSTGNLQYETRGERIRGYTSIPPEAPLFYAEGETVTLRVDHGQNYELDGIVEYLSKSGAVQKTQVLKWMQSVEGSSCTVSVLPTSPCRVTWNGRAAGSTSADGTDDSAEKPRLFGGATTIRRPIRGGATEMVPHSP